MSNISKKLEWEKKFDKRFVLEMVVYRWKPVKDFIRQLLLSQKDEIADKLLKAFNLTIKDLPAFPPKGIDLWDLILKIGIEKVKREQREEIIKEVERSCRLFLQDMWNDQSEIQALSPEGKEIIWGGVIGKTITENWLKIKNHLLKSI